MPAPSCTLPTLQSPSPTHGTAPCPHLEGPRGLAQPGVAHTGGCTRVTVTHTHLSLHTQTHPRSGCTTRQWGLSSPWITAFLKEPSSLATLICFLLAS